jgi:hypothetical protein
LGDDNRAAVLPEGERAMILKFKDVTSEQLHKLTQLIDSKLRSGKLLQAAYPHFREQRPAAVVLWSGELELKPCTANGYWLGDQDTDHPLAQIISTKVDNTLLGTFFEVTITLIEHFLFHASHDSTTHKQTEVIHTPCSILKEIMEALDLFPAD